MLGSELKTFWTHKNDNEIIQAEYPSIDEDLAFAYAVLPKSLKLNKN